MKRTPAQGIKQLVVLKETSMGGPTLLPVAEKIATEAGFGIANPGSRMASPEESVGQGLDAGTAGGTHDLAPETVGKGAHSAVANSGLLAAWGQMYGGPPAITPESQPLPVKQGYKQKPGDLVPVLLKNQDLIRKNGYDEKGESRIAGLMSNEGGPNERRAGISSYFNHEARSIKPDDIEKFRKDPTLLDQSKYDDDQKYLINRVLSGNLQLKNRQQVTEAGIDRRVEQYTEMEQLANLERNSPGLSKEENAQVEAKLKNLRGQGHNGFGPTLGDMEGMSPARFREIYEEGSQRFEISHYKKYKSAYEEYVKNGSKGNFSFGGIKFSPQMMTSIGQNFDLFSDMSTSYGPGQILGSNVFAKNFNYIDEKGAAQSPTMNDLKNSAKPHNTSRQDIGLVMAYCHSANISLNTDSAEQIASGYNGPAWKSQNPQYANNLTNHAASYFAAKRAIGSGGKSAAGAGATTASIKEGAKPVRGRRPHRH